MRLALVQINATVGDFEGNRRLIVEGARRAHEAGARLAVFPELALTGYPPLDLLERSPFVEAAAKSEAQIVDAIPEGLTVVFGTVRRRPTPPVAGRALENIAVVAERGRVRLRVTKTLIPTYDVFDEARYFEPKTAKDASTFEVEGVRVGVTICEDLWNDDDLWENHDLWRDKAPGSYRLYDRDPVKELVERAQPDLLVNISASPWARGKETARRSILEHVARKYGVAVAYTNLVGGNDGLLFDGHSTLYDRRGRHRGTAKGWQDDVFVVDLEGEPLPVPDRDEASEICEGLTVGIRDYLDKTGIALAIVGLSGGIDSAVTATLAVRALGSERVLGVGMPSRYSSPGSVTDAEALAENLGIQFLELPIEPMFSAFLDTLAPAFGGAEEDVTEENLQSRIRGVLLMALANKRSGVVLNTGNKSEAAMGYATLYGDAIGALSVLGDLYKHQVYAQARHANRAREVIPRSTIDKAPSAELRPDQRDEDSLPPYEQLDEMLRLFIEHRATVDEVATEVGVDRTLAARVNRAIHRAEFKRKQLPPTLRVSRKAWGGRRFPIVQRFDEP